MAHAELSGGGASKATLRELRNGSFPPFEDVGSVRSVTAGNTNLPPLILDHEPRAAGGDHDGWGVGVA
jgi:hypothetical protein